MAPLAGLTGLNEGASSQVTDEGVLSAHGNVGGYDSSHSNPGDTSGESWPAGWGDGYKGTSYGAEIDNSGQQGVDYRASGVAIDQTPNTHISPYPRGLWQPNLQDANSFADTADALQAQRKQLHGRDLGGVRKLNGFSPAGREVETHFTTDRYESPNQTGLSGDVPGQIRGTGNALRDTTQGFGQLNDNPEFQAGHSIRIVQHDSMPWDRSLAYPRGKPFLGRHPQIPASFGNDSSYGVVAGDTSTGQQVMERRGFPTPYQAPALPEVQPSASSGPENDVWAY